MNNFAEDSMKLHNRNLQGMYLSNLVANPRVHYTVDLQTSAQQMLGANSCSNAFSENALFSKSFWILPIFLYKQT